MKTINPFDFEYKVFILREDRPDLNITELIESGSYGDTKGDSVSKLNLRLPYIYFSDRKKWSDELLCNGTYIAVYADKEEVFRGRIRNNSLNRSGNSNSVSVTAYDNAFLLANSKHSVVYVGGSKTSELVKDICMHCELTVDYDYPEIEHGVIFNKDKARLEEINDLLDAVQSEMHCTKPVLMIKNNTVSIKEQGSNTDIYVFEINEDNPKQNALTQFSRTSSVENIITRVVVHGLEVEENMRPIDAVKDGKTEFGIIEANYFTEKDDTQEQTEQKIQKIFDEHGDQENTFSFDSLDIPGLRKGQRIKVVYPGEPGKYFFVSSITHDISSRTMSFDVEEIKD